MKNRNEVVLVVVSHATRDNCSVLSSLRRMKWFRILKQNCREGVHTPVSVRHVWPAASRSVSSVGLSNVRLSLPPPEEIVALTAHLLRERILGYLGLANKAGKIISGGSLVSDAIRSGNKPGLVLVATDVSEAIGKRIETLAGCTSHTVRMHHDKR